MLLRRFVVPVSVIVLAACSSKLLAQTTGTLRGTITDSSGAVVANARASAVLQTTENKRTVTSDSRGDFVIPALPVGRYSLMVEAVGFKTFYQTDIDITIGHVVAVNTSLMPGKVMETMTVTTAPPLVEQTSTQLGAIVDEKTVVDLPLNQRDTYQLLTLQPGVSSQVGSNLFYGNDQTGAVSVNGGRGRSNNFMVNGGDANDQFVNLPAVQPSPDAIQEFRVLTNSFDPEYGRNSGSVVNVVTKSGSNLWHGDAYEFFRNQALNAKYFFSQTKADFKQNQFGGTFGGPIQRDKTFFFVSYEARRIAQGIASDVVTVPTADERKGIFAGGFPLVRSDGSPNQISDQPVADALKQRTDGVTTCEQAINNLGGATPAAGALWANVFPTGTVPTQCMDPTAVDLMNQWVPPGNLSNSTYQTSPNDSLHANQFTARVDHKLTSSQQLQVYYFFNDAKDLKPFNTNSDSGANVPNFGAINANRYQQWNIGHSWLINSTSVNEFRFTYLREGLNKFNSPQNTHLVSHSCATVDPSHCFGDPNNPRWGITPSLGASIEGTPNINVFGMFAIGNNWQGALPQIGNAFEWSDHFTKVAGRHTFKFGGDIQRQRFDQLQLFNVNGQFNITGGANSPSYSNLMPDYLLGLADSYSQGSAQHLNIRNTIAGLYVQDSWKLRSDLTFNYGLRWELNTPLTDVGQHVQAFRPGQATSIFPCQLPDGTDCNPGSARQDVFPLGLVFPGDKGVSKSLTSTYYKSFAPRFGLAWSPGWNDGVLGKLMGGSGKTSVRAGYGIFYDNVEQLVSEQFGDDPPFGGSAILSNVFLNTPFRGQDGTVNPNPFNGILSPQRGKPVDWSSFRPIALFGQFPAHLRSQYTEQYNLTIQRELNSSTVLSLAYVGSVGHRLLATHDLNYGQAQTCLALAAMAAADSSWVLNASGGSPATCANNGADNSYYVSPGAVIQSGGLYLPYGPHGPTTIPAGTVVGANGITLVGLRRYSSPFCDPMTGNSCPIDQVPVWGSVFTQDNVANSNYNSFQAELTKRFSKGLQFQAAYTLGKSFDYASSFEDLLNPLDPRRSYSLSQFSSKHRFVLSYYWQLPVPKFEGFQGKALNGWGLSGIVTLQSGFPIRITSNADNELQNSFDFLTPGEPNLIAPFHGYNPPKKVQLDPNDPKSVVYYAFDAASFSDSALGTIGNSRRTICCGPPIENVDFSVLKNTAIGERVKAEFRAEFFNMFNHSQFYNPDGNTSDGANFGQVLRARDPRLVQFALKLTF